MVEWICSGGAHTLMDPMSAGPRRARRIGLMAGRGHVAGQLDRITKTRVDPYEAVDDRVIDAGKAPACNPLGDRLPPAGFAALEAMVGSGGRLQGGLWEVASMDRPPPANRMGPVCGLGPYHFTSIAGSHRTPVNRPDCFEQLLRLMV